MASPFSPSPLLAPLFSSAAMRAVTDDKARLQRMLDFEAALAQAEAGAGVIPAKAAAPIADACRAERFDLGKIAEDAVAAGNIAIPLVKMLTAEVAKADKEASGYVHWGATSQDVIDTALVLELREAIDVLGDRSRPRRRGLQRTGEATQEHTRRGAHLDAAGAADALRAQARRLCRGARARQRSPASAARGSAGAAIRRCGRHPRRAGR